MSTSDSDELPVAGSIPPDEDEPEESTGCFEVAVQNLREAQGLVLEQARRMSTGVRALMDTGEHKALKV